MPNAKVKVTIEFELPFDKEELKDKSYLLGCMRQEVFDEVTNYAVCRHLEDALTWIGNPSPNAKIILDSHKVWADRLQKATSSIEVLLDEKA